MKKTLKRIVVGLLIGLVVLVVGYKVKNANDSKKDGIISARLEDASEFTTQKLIYRGLVKMEKGAIPLINKTECIMTYTATVRAGCDMSDVKVEESETAVQVSVPEMEIQDITIDPSSIEFYGTSLTLFEADGKEVAKEALEKAEKDAKKNVKKIWYFKCG